MKSSSPVLDIAEYTHGYHYPDESVFRTREGLDEGIVNAISERKEEPEWMRQYRLRALAAFRKKAMPSWGADLSEHRLRRAVLLCASSGAAVALVGRRARQRSRRPSSASASPRPSGSSWRASGRSTTPRSSTTASRKSSASRGSSSRTPRRRCASTPTS